MRPEQKFFLKGFARVSPVFRGLLGAAICACLALCAPPAGAAKAAVPAAARRQAAEAQFTRAEAQRAALNSKPADKRTLLEYKQVVSSYRRVYLITPHAAEVPDALLAVAELYSEMGDRFGRVYYQSSVDSYQFLLREYPTSRYCQDALLRVAKIQRMQLGDAPGAKVSYEDFLKRFPRSPRKREVQEALAEIALVQSAAEPAPAAQSATNSQPAARGESSDTATASDRSELPRPAGATEVPRVRRIRATAGADSTRITIDLEDSVQYTSGRIHNPDRIYFDLHTARLTPEVARGNIQVEGSMLTGIRVAQNKIGVVRVVLDVKGVKDYTAAQLTHPDRLVIDLYASARAMRAGKAKQAEELRAAADDGGAVKSGAKSDANRRDAADQSVMESAAAPAPGVVLGRSANGAASARAPKPSAAAKGKSLRASRVRPDLIRPATVPSPTRDGQDTLTRALGLKIGRIVIDAGHGGHDTGTIGPTGLMEKDLCLDVALRLGKLIHQRLPGADVIYTRSDDTFIPLEERTHIANEAKADLFISIHANSSHDQAARGIETYYLNLRGSAEAMEVAARENATSDQGIHDLQDVVRQIARTEKIDESREFAADVQDSLSKRILKSGRGVNRGVRKAPFVVLIGADMPSILTEISFLSNAADEQLLKRPEQRQRVADGIYQGISSYLQSMNSVAVNRPRTAPERTAAVASVAQSGNRQ
jgi:N-acetylmuramoyl-L-alanine amidase